MKPRPTLVLLLLVVTAIGLAVPLVAAAIECEEGGVDCCGLDCALCVCCSHAPTTVLIDLDRCSRGAIGGRLGPENAEKPRDPLLRGVLHVPRPAPAS